MWYIPRTARCDSTKAENGLPYIDLGESSEDAAAMLVQTGSEDAAHAFVQTV